MNPPSIDMKKDSSNSSTKETASSQTTEISPEPPVKTSSALSEDSFVKSPSTLLENSSVKNPSASSQDESSPPEILTDPDETTICDAPNDDVIPFDAEPVEPAIETTNEVLNITSEQLAEALPEGNTLSYGKLISQLGLSANFGHTGIQIYKLDGNKVLTLRFQNVDDICTMSGEELAQTAVPLDEPDNFPTGSGYQNSQWIYGIIVDSHFLYSESGGSPCCYSLSYPDKESSDSPDSSIIRYADGTGKSNNHLSYGEKVLVSFDELLETHPPTIICNEIIII